MDRIFSVVSGDMVTPDFIFKTLEELKSQGASNVSLYYGENAGVDDAEVEPKERNIRIMWLPCGATSPAVRILWQGKLAALASFDFGQFPTIITHTEAANLLPDQPGFYMWGDPDVIDFYKAHGTLDYRKWK